MAFVRKDRVRETTITTGTGSVVLAGATTGYVTFASVMSVNDTCYYCIQGGSEWEVGLGTYTFPGSVPTLVRTTVLSSSNSGSAVNFSAGTKDIFITVAAAEYKRPYNTVVAPSGGDYTTISAAVAAGAVSIFIKNGTYTETGDIALSANTQITGETRDGVIVDLNAHMITTANNTHLDNFTLQNWGTYAITGTGADVQLHRLTFLANVVTYNNPLFINALTHFIIDECWFKNATASVTSRWITDGSTACTGRISHCFFDGNFQMAMLFNKDGIIHVENNWFTSTYTDIGTCYMIDWQVTASVHDTRIANNYFSAGANNQHAIYLNGTRNMSVTDNNIAVKASTATGIILIDADNALVEGNFIITALVGINIDSTTDGALIGINQSAAGTYIIDAGTNTVRVGKTSYQTTVASSGGDYTTLGAAITAGKTRIFVRNGTYTETGDIALSAGTIIVGESRDGVVIDLANTYGITLGGDGIQLENFTITKWGSTGGIYGVAAATYRNVSILKLMFKFTNAQTNMAKALSMHGLRDSEVAFCKFVNLSTTVHATTAIYEYQSTGSYNLKITDCDFDKNNTYGFLTAISAPNYPHFNLLIKGCTFDGSLSSAATGSAIDISGSNATNINILGNTLISSSSTWRFVHLGASSNYSILIAGNTGYLSSSAGVAISIDAAAHDVRVYDNDISCKELVNISDSGANNIRTIGNVNVLANGGGGHIFLTDAGVGNVFLNNGPTPNRVEEKDWRRMQNTSGGTIAAGSVVVFKSSVAAGTDITTTTTASDPLVYGVTGASISNNQYGYVQVLGSTKILKADGTTDIAIGDYLTTFTTAGIARKATAGTLGTTPGDLAFAIALEAYTTNDSLGVLDAILIAPIRL